MSAINVASGSIVPAALASGATAAGATAGVTSLAVQTLPTTGAGMTLLLVIIAITFVLVGAVLLWNPLNRRQRRLPVTERSSDRAPHSALAHH
jgi:TRAP-type C4-dicarboxylate transport system permease small subunit